jgi:uncharacterized repeat protein (TIGR01451 family)
MKAKYTSFLKLAGSLCALALLGAPSLGTAGTITVMSLLVVVGGQAYCDTTFPAVPPAGIPSCGGNVVWNFNGGVTLSDNQTFILTQTGNPLMQGGENFDTSDRGPMLRGCSDINNQNTPCTVQIYMDTGSGLQQVVNDPSGDFNPLASFNMEPTTDETTAEAKMYNEAAGWVPAPDFSGTNFALDLGYADNIHIGSCAATSIDCLPQAVWCTTTAPAVPTTNCPSGTFPPAGGFFLGVGIGNILGCGIMHQPTDSQSNHVGCFDAGALRITAHPPNLTIQKTPTSGNFTVGSQVSYTIVVGNNGHAGSVAHNVMLTDALPGNGGLVWQTATTTQGTCTNPIVSNGLSCQLGDIPAGGSVTVTVTSTATTPTAACQDQPNPVAAATDNEGQRVTAAGDQTCNQQPPSLAIVKNPKNGTFLQGGQTTFTIVVSNPAAVGSQPATNVLLSDPLPGNGGLVWTTATTSQGSCSIASNLLNCSLGTIQPQGSVTITVSSAATTPAAACQSQPNPAATATADGGLSVHDNGSLTCVPPQLAVVKSPKNGTFPSGGQTSFTIVVSNPAAAGGSPATNVHLHDVLPGNGGLVWTTATTTQGTCSIASNVLDCSLNTIAAQGSVTIIVSSGLTTPPAACQLQNNPDAHATADGGLVADDSGSLTCSPQPQLRVVKSPKNGTFTQGGQTSFTIVVSNPAGAGSQPATNVLLNDQLPGNGGLIWTTATTSQGSCSIANNILNCALGTIQPQGSVSITVSSGPTTPPAACQLQNNPDAHATADGGLVADDNGSLTCTPPQLRVVKSPKGGAFTQGGQTTFNILVSNPATAGASPATNVLLNDQLPGNGGLVWTTATTSQGSCSIANNVLSCTLGTIQPQGSVAITVSSAATTPASACTSQPNPVALATADGGLQAQDSGSLNCTPPQLTVVKSPKNGAFTQGGQTTFTIVVSNPAAAGAQAATNAHLHDVLPGNGGLIWTTATATQGSCSIASNVLDCSLNTIAPQGSVTVTVSSAATTPASACTSQPNPVALATADGGLQAQDSGSLNCTPSLPQCVAASINTAVSPAASFAAIGLQGSQFSLSSGPLQVTGALGIGAAGTFHLSGGAKLISTLYADPTAAVQIDGGSFLTGGTLIQSMQAVQNAAIALSSSAAALTPTQTFSQIISALVITGDAGQNVISVPGTFHLSGGNNLTLSGSASSTFIINVRSGLQLDGGASIVLSGVSPDHVLFNFPGGGGQVQTSGGANTAGIFLAPQMPMQINGGTHNSEFISGGQLSFQSNPKVSAPICIQ